jgi:hypothetical protein
MSCPFFPVIFRLYSTYLENHSSSLLVASTSIGFLEVFFFFALPVCTSSFVLVVIRVDQLQHFVLQGPVTHPRERVLGAFCDETALRLVLNVYRESSPRGIL